MKSYNPKISIITVVYNGGRYLEKTIQSVINQTYSNIEYIIIDGGSTDGTVDIIKKYEDRIDYWVSEKDNGIYDAMNKGLDVSTGEWINFMNAGDSFYNQDVLKEIFSRSYPKNIGILYGRTDIGRKVLRYKKDISLIDMGEGMIICHQSTFYKNDKSIRYNNYKICGDQEFTMQYLQKYKAKYLNIIVSNYLLGGVSSKNTKITLQEKYIINKMYNLSIYPIFKSLLRSYAVKFRDFIIG